MRVTKEFFLSFFLFAFLIIGCDKTEVAEEDNSLIFDLSGQEKFREPVEWKTENGSFSKTLTLTLREETKSNLDLGLCTGKTLTVQSYNGNHSGPTWRVKPGDTLRITLKNNLPEEESSKPSNWPMNIPHGLNTTNLHTHGLHVSPREDSDNVLLQVAPGETLEYEIKIPLDHPPGTFWYHPHKHGSVMSSMVNGLSGFIIIEGPDEGALEDYDEKLIIIQEFQVEGDCEYLKMNYDEPPTLGYNIEEIFGASSTDILPFPDSVTTVNGQHEPVLTIETGRPQRWRFLNATLDDAYPIRIQPVTDTAVPTIIDISSLLEEDQSNIPIWYQIAHDGFTFKEPRKISEFDAHWNWQNDPNDAWKNIHGTHVDKRFRLLAGNRGDVVLYAKVPGLYEVVSTGTDTNNSIEHGEPRRLFYLEVKGDLVDEIPNFPPKLVPADVETLVNEEVSITRTIAYKVCPSDIDPDTLGFQMPPGCEEPLEKYILGDDVGIPLLDPLFLVGHREEGGNVLRTFDPGRVDHCMVLDKVEEWVVCNPTLSEHPFHIHQNSFELLEKNGILLDPPIWLDTATVPLAHLPSGDSSVLPSPCTDWDPPGGKVQAGWIRFRIKPVDFAGVFVQHCHMLRHEELGMMQLIQIADPDKKDISGLEANDVEKGTACYGQKVPWQYPNVPEAL